MNEFSAPTVFRLIRYHPNVLIASWNVNSIRARLGIVSNWIAQNHPDVLMMQELKGEVFPADVFEPLGYQSVAVTQKTYNGVAILSPAPLEAVTIGIPGFVDDQKRVIAATVGGVRVVSAYFPNGQAVGSEKFEYKMRWIAALTDWLREELRSHERLVLGGDFNIAPEDRDAHPDWKDEIHVSPQERAAFAGLTALGLTDAFRLFEQPERSFSWWDYRMGAFRRNFGLRIDHLLLSSGLLEQCRSCAIDKTPRKLERPSDHAPVMIELAC